MNQSYPQPFWRLSAIMEFFSWTKILKQRTVFIFFNSNNKLLQIPLHLKTAIKDNRPQNGLQILMNIKINIYLQLETKKSKGTTHGNLLI